MIVALIICGYLVVGVLVTAANVAAGLFDSYSLTSGLWEPDLQLFATFCAVLLWPLLLFGDVLALIAAGLLRAVEFIARVDR